MDAAQEWIERYAAQHPALAEALADGLVQQRARGVTVLWRRTNEMRVMELRRSPAIRNQMSLSHAHRTLTAVLRAFCTKHGTFATFLSEPLDGLQRWQMFMIVVTLVLEQLLVNIWMCARARG